MNTEAIEEFKAFVNDELLSATKELEKIKSEGSRKHLQKLVYTNLVDRFDTMVDQCLIENSSHPVLVHAMSKNLEKPLTEAEFVKSILLSSNLKEAAEGKVRESLRASLLRDRHSKKLSKVCAVFIPNEEVWNKPRVNISTGEILRKFTPQIKTTPHSVCGYADWLYARRNAIVHKGKDSKLLKNDMEQIKELFKCKTNDTFKVQLSSIKVSAKYYLSLTGLLLGKHKEVSS